MGGFGSGNHRIDRKRQTSECALVLDIKWLVHYGLIAPELRRKATITWQQLSGRNCEMRLDVDTRCMEFSRMDVCYGYFDETKISDTIMLRTTHPNFGGIRWWFDCKHTGKRTTKLYLTSMQGVIASREALNLSYPSQNENRQGRLLNKAQRIRRDLNGSISLSKPFPERPKGMWLRTYLRQRSQGLSIETQIFQEALNKFGLR